MIGVKNLSTIRRQIRKSLGSGDPIKWLENQMADAKRQGESTEILQGLKQFLESAKKTRRKRRPVEQATGAGNWCQPLIPLRGTQKQ